MGHARILHDGGHVGKVQIDEAGVTDQVGNGLHRLTQHVVGDLEGVGEGDLLVGGELQPLVGNDDKGVHLVPQLADAGLGLLSALAALEPEGLGDDAHGQHAQLAGDLGHHRSRACAGAAAHAGGDEDHIGVLERLGDLVAALLGGLAADLGIGACALSAGQLFADLQLIVGAGSVQRLLVRIHGDKIDALGSAAHHAVDHIVAAAANADHLDTDYVFHACFQSKSHVRSLR